MNNDFIKKGSALIKKAAAAYLTTIDENGFPSTRAMFNLRNSVQFPKLASFMSQFDNSLTSFFTTNTSSIKMRQIIKNPKVAVYYCDTVIYQGLMCQGNIEIENDKSVKHSIWHEEWKMYYPEGRDSEDYTILRLQPFYAKSYFQLNQTDIHL